MEYVLLGALSVAAIALLMMNTIATISVSRTRQLNLGQKLGQVAFIWCLPFVGAMFVTHLLAASDPGVVVRRWIPNDTINAYVLQVLAVQARASLQGTRAAIEGSIIDPLSAPSDHSASDASGGGDGD
jgi:hypothetical protein